MFLTFYPELVSDCLRFPPTVLGNIIMSAQSRGRPGRGDINCHNLTRTGHEIVSFILWPRNIERDIEKITGHSDSLLSMTSEVAELSYFANIFLSSD